MPEPQYLMGWCVNLKPHFFQRFFNGSASPMLRKEQLWEAYALLVHLEIQVMQART